MKKDPFALFLALTLLTLTLMSCSAPAFIETASTTPSGTDPGDRVSAEPSDDIESLPSFDEMTGFENSQWGESIEDVLMNVVANSQNIGTIRIEDYSANFAGLQFRAEYLFESDENKGTKLFSGVLYRDSYIDAFEPQSGLEKAIEDYNLLLAYLTEIYGTPWRSYINTEDGSSIDVEDNINNFMELEAQRASAAWTATEDDVSKQALVLCLSSKGVLYIQFFSDI